MDVDFCDVDLFGVDFLLVIIIDLCGLMKMVLVGVCGNEEIYIGCGVVLLVCDFVFWGMVWYFYDFCVLFQENQEMIVVLIEELEVVGGICLEFFNEFGDINEDYSYYFECVQVQ